MQQYTPSQYLVNSNSNTSSPLDGNLHYVKNVYTHPKFRGSSNHFHHDVGILELQDEILITTTSRLTTLAHSNDETPAGRVGRVSGWGENPDHPNDNRLYQVELNVISAQNCSSQFGSDEDQIEEHEICAQAPGKNFCKGDSGGPMIDTATNRQIGIVSYGARPCTAPYPSVFAKVTDNLDFIRKTIRQTRRNRY